MLLMLFYINVFSTWDSNSSFHSADDGQIGERSFISTVRPTVHVNFTENFFNFSKTLFKHATKVKTGKMGFESKRLLFLKIFF